MPNYNKRVPQFTLLGQPRLMINMITSQLDQSFHQIVYLMFSRRAFQSMLNGQPKLTISMTTNQSDLLSHQTQFHMLRLPVSQCTSTGPHRLTTNTITDQLETLFHQTLSPTHKQQAYQFTSSGQHKPMINTIISQSDQSSHQTLFPMLNYNKIDHHPATPTFNYNKPNKLTMLSTPSLTSEVEPNSTRTRSTLLSPLSKTSQRRSQIKTFFTTSRWFNLMSILECNKLVNNKPRRRPTRRLRPIP